MRVLAVSTSASEQGLCLRQPGAADAVVRQVYRRGQPRQLTRTIWQLLAQADLTPADLDLLVADVGPGSFTGLRLGLATVRAMAWATGVPAVGIGSFEAMLAEVASCGPTEPPWLAVLPSRRGVLYAGIGDATGCGRAAEVPLVDLTRWCDDGEPGGGAIAGLLGPHATLDLVAPLFAPSLPRCERSGPSPGQICDLGVTAFTRGNVDAELALQPRYLAVSEAERAADRSARDGPASSAAAITR